MEQDKIFKCYKCGKTYKLKSILLLHSMKCNEIDSENNDKEVSETKTQISPKQKQKMKGKEYSIIIENDSSKSYQCNRCEKKFNTQTHITQHHYNVHREMKFKCEKCDKSFPFKSLLKIHVGKCNGSLKERRPQTLRNKEYKIIEDENSRKIYQCMRCGKNFNYLQGIHQHFYNVHREKNFNCKQCKKSFPHRFNLKSHLKMCLDGQGTKCEKCDKSFLSRTNLEVHRWNCGKTKEFKCRICDTVFKSPYVVQGHFDQFHKEKRFKCEKCTEIFTFKSGLKSHKIKCGTKEGHTQERSNSKLKIHLTSMKPNRVSIILNNEGDISAIKLRDTDVFKIANVRGNDSKDPNLESKSGNNLEYEPTIKVEENDEVLSSKESNEARELKNEVEEKEYILGF